MRISIMILCCALGFAGPVFGGASPNAPRSIPAWRAQADARGVDARGDFLRRQANGIFDREMQREKAGDCDSAATTAAINSCLSQAVKITDMNLKTYEDALRGLLGLRYANSGETAASSGSGGGFTPEQQVTAFDQMEQHWHAYLDSASTIAAHQLDRGTGDHGTGMETHIRLVRSHMHELENIYYSLLYL